MRLRAGGTCWLLATEHLIDSAPRVPYGRTVAHSSLGFCMDGDDLQRVFSFQFENTSGIMQNLRVVSLGITLRFMLELFPNWVRRGPIGRAGAKLH